MKNVESRIQDNRGQSLMEMLVAIAVVGIVLASVAGLVYVGLLAGSVSRENSFAQILIQDMSSAVRGMAASEWRAMWGSAGLISYWGMNEGADVRLYDPVSGNNATAVNAPIWESTANCRAGRCLSFNGSTQFADIGSSPSFNTERITVAAWVHSATTTADLAAISRFVGADGDWLLDHGSVASTYRFLVRIGGVNHLVQSSAGFSVGDWNHLVGTYDGSHLRLYVNGVERASAPIAGRLVANTTAVRIGNRAANTHHWNGRIDEVRVFGRALSAAEVAAMHASPDGLSPRSLGGFWAIHEGPETVPSPPFGAFRRWFVIESVQRDIAGNIVMTGGTPDPSTINLHYRVLTPRGRTITASEVITRSGSRVTVQEDWAGGPHAVGTYSAATTVFATSTNISASPTLGTIRIASTTAHGQTGTLDSAIFDTRQIGGVAYNYIIWRGGVDPAGSAQTRVDFQIASSNSPDGPWTFVGHDCTVTARYSNLLAGTQRALTARCHTGHRYFSYRIFLVSLDGVATPIVDDVIVGWSP